MDRSIGDAAREVGCDGYFVWEIAPDNFANHLLTAAKRYSRFLKDAGLAKSHSEGLEVVARASGFPHWHAFQNVVQGLFDAFNPEVHWPRPKGGREPIKALIPAFVFLVQTSPDCAPTAAEQIGLSKAATQLAKACGSALEPALDMVGKMNGADSWEKLLTRKPEESKGPLYGFQLDEQGNGRFVISSACSALIDKQDVLFQGFDNRPESQQREFEIYLAGVLKARPDFLEGLLASAEVLRFRPEMQREQGKIYAAAISKADGLIPAGFKGEVSWYDLSNRFYHRLLYGAMVWNSFQGRTAKAVTLARRQLRLNKSDNLGVRMWLPVLLIADGQPASADKASRKMVQDEDYTDAGIELVRAICHFANGRVQQSAESLFLALFMYPPMKHVISVDFEALDDALNDKQSSRTVLPDPETMVDQYVSATMQLEGLGQTFKQWICCPAVVSAEAELAQEFHANWRVPNGTLHRWDAEMKRHATLLSKARHVLMP